MIQSVLLCLVVAITDGNTLKIRCGEPGAHEQVTIRVGAIDAPEKRMPFGARSKQALSDLCYKVSASISPKTKDRHGRAVADVECNGRDAGAEQLKAGMAWVYDSYAKGYGHLYPLQDAARVARTGLWCDAAPTPPWEWRHR